MMKVTLLAFTSVYAVTLLAEATYLSCPPSSGGVGICSEMCSADAECSLGEKCCSNGCGHSCAKALVIPYHNPPLRCPAASVSQCTTSCQANANCSSGEMCCPMSGCGTICVRGETPTPLCPVVRDQVSNATLIGAYLPSCEADGSFTPVQCHGSTGYCWCVDPVSGVPQSDMVRFQKPQCVSPLAFFSCPAPQSEVVGTCDEQCDATSGCQRGQKCCSNGCGHACTSALLPIPYVAPQKGAQSPFCKDVHEQATSKGLLGGFVPQCDASGNFLTLQCHESSCWCVNPESGQPTSDMASGSAVDTLPCSGCYYNGTVHTNGEKFDVDTCGGYCTCTDNKHVVCATVQCHTEDEESIGDSDWWYGMLMLSGVIAIILALVTMVLFMVVVGVVRRQHQFRHMKVRTTEEFTVFTKYSPSDEETDLSKSKEMQA
ncbi:hypothetical protein EMCRGX_G032515 [Ephydatia muelleri]